MYYMYYNVLYVLCNITILKLMSMSFCPIFYLKKCPNLLLYYIIVLRIIYVYLSDKFM